MTKQEKIDQAKARLASYGIPNGQSNVGFATLSERAAATGIPVIQDYSWNGKKWIPV